MANEISNDQLAAMGIGRRPQQKPSDQLGQKDFLKLMTTQLQNQDPMKPMENGEFLSQMAQFASVRGIQDLKDSFNQLTQSLHSDQALQASSLVGREVLVPGNEARLAEGESISGAIDLPQGVDGLRVRVVDASGEVVNSLDLGEQQKGRVDFAWDGTNGDGQPAGAGAYKLEALARVGGREVAAETMLSAEVTGVTLDKGHESLSLDLAGIGSRALSEIRHVQ